MAIPPASASTFWASHGFLLSRRYMLLESRVVLKDIERSRQAAFGIARSKLLGTSATINSINPMSVPLQGFRRAAEGAESTHGRGESRRFGVEKLDLRCLCLPCYLINVAQNRTAKSSIENSLETCTTGIIYSSNHFEWPHLRTG